jgi:hypothetical protein
MLKQDDFYVYVYIDPRNHEEFYYGMGQGKRKDQHLRDSSDSTKTKTIRAIKQAKLDPIIRVIARGLTQEQAFLVEKTLLWKLGKNLTNQATGSFSKKFRKPNTLDHDLPGFDYVEDLYYFNVGQGDHRQWSDCKRFGFISAGQGKKWRDSICNFREGDIVAAYLKRRGFVGIGRVTHRARPIRNVTIEGRPMSALALTCGRMLDNVESDEKCEYVALVKWLRTVASEPHWKSKSGLFTTQNIRASLQNQPKTVRFLEKRFNIALAKYQSGKPRMKKQSSARTEA